MGGLSHRGERGEVHHHLEAMLDDEALDRAAVGDVGLGVGQPLAVCPILEPRHRLAVPA